MPDSSNYSARRARVRYTLTVPQHDNHGRGLGPEHAEVRARLLRYFGAYTSHDSRGAWRAADTGREHTDASIVYTVDVPNNRAAYAQMLSLADYVRKAARQECVYLTRQPVETWCV